MSIKYRNRETGEVVEASEAEADVRIGTEIITTFPIVIFKLNDLLNGTTRSDFHATYEPIEDTDDE